MITKDDVVKDLTHWRAGNGHAFVMWMEEEGYCRVTPYLNDEFLKRVYVVSMDHLNPTTIKGQELIPPDALKKIQELQQDLESGKKFLRDTHVEVAV